MLLDMPILKSSVLFTYILDSKHSKNLILIVIDKYILNLDLIIRPSNKSVVAAVSLLYTIKENYLICLT